MRKCGLALIEMSMYNCRLFKVDDLLIICGASFGLSRALPSQRCLGIVRTVSTHESSGKKAIEVRVNFGRQGDGLTLQISPHSFPQACSKLNLGRSERIQEN